MSLDASLLLKSDCVTVPSISPGPSAPCADGSAYQQTRKYGGWMGGRDSKCGITASATGLRGQVVGGAAVVAKEKGNS